MRQRKAVGEVIAVALLLVVTAAVMTIVISHANEQIFSERQTASEAIAKSQKRVQELVSLIGISTNSDGMAVDLLNYGRQTITVEKVMVDGITSAYHIYKSDGTVLGSILPVKEPVTLQASNTGKTVQILTTSGNLFDFSA
ncbi:MAG: hypothetical protein LDL06_04175 [Candidatus Nitrosotenuis sp.]|nr:hypothetical protein [Candidatus Nitrosotenuis sp.]